LNKNKLSVERIQFTEDTDGISQKNWKKNRLRTLYWTRFGKQETLTKDPRVQTEARTYWSERYHCGRTGTRPGKPDTNTSFNTQISREMGLTQTSFIWTIHRDVPLCCFFVTV